MRFMIIVKATKKSEAGVMPSEQLLSEMGKFNEELVKAGVMLAGEGLQPFQFPAASPDKGCLSALQNAAGGGPGSGPFVPR